MPYPAAGCPRFARRGDRLNKAALYDAIVEAVIVDIEGSPNELSLPLYDFLIVSGREFRAALLRHPNTVPLLATRPLATPIGMKVADAMLGVLINAGLTPPEGIAAIDAFSAFVIAFVHREAQNQDEPEHNAHAQMQKMKEILTPTRFPNLGRAMAEGGLMDFESEFEFGLQALAYGLASVAARRAAE